MFVQVAFNLPLDKTFTYKKPDAETDSLFGKRVTASFRSRKLKGMVVGESPSANDVPEKTIKEIDTVIDREPIFAEREYERAAWIAKYYYCSIGEALFASLPAGEPPKRKKLPKKPKREVKPFLTLNDEQAVAYTHLEHAFKNNLQQAFLLFGVTGSGKTEVYLHIIRDVIEQNKQAIIVIPEISLTPQTIKRFEERFSEHIAVLHSRLSKTEKYLYWQGIRKGEIRLIIGARSAIFSPTKDLGIIIIDEEHEGSYKASDTPRFHTRQIAFHRMAEEGCLLLMGSATPSLESYAFAKEEKGIELLTLKKRVENIILPPVKVIDMKKARKADIFPLMSEDLVEAVNNALDKKTQTILFLNRKGYSPVVMCQACGTTMMCPNCSVTLTFHKVKDAAVCHYCGYLRRIGETCDECGEGELKLTGAGTEKVEEHLEYLFPNAKIARMDHETTRKVGAYETILDAFAEGKTDILVGTQMISKGLHFPNVTLVGVLHADISLNLPDFRAAEKTFNLITQVSGRSGRGEKPGLVYLQTYNPLHYAIKCAQEHNYEGFYRTEVLKREALAYPPFGRLLRLVIRGVNEREVVLDAEEITKTAHSFFAEQQAYVTVLGPAPCALSKLQKYYRWNVLFKATSQRYLSSFINFLRSEYTLARNNYLEIDVDPYNML